MKKIISIFIILLLSTACTNKTETELQQYLSNFKIGLNKQGKTIIVIIPLTGCHTCIAQTINVLNNITNIDKITIIIPTYDRTLFTSYRKKLPSNSKCFRDKKERINNYPTVLNNTNPKLFFIEDGKINNSIVYDFSMGEKFLSMKVNNFLEK